ncbi:MAG: PDZ domain-containing protein [Anaerolineae bacterium]|nr:PDZ domain-containing protein [Anaerolineae bacterium]
MKLKHLIYVMLVAVLVSAVGLVAAQDGQTQGKNGTPFVGIRYAEAEAGIVIEEVVADSPAATAGLEVGDVVTAVDGEAVTIDNFATVIRAKAVGDSIVLTVTRAEASQEVSVTLGETTGRQGGRRSGGMMPEIFANQPFLGVRLEDQDGALTVAEVVADSPAATAGLQVGDVITQLNGEPVTDAESFVAGVQALEVGAEVALTITRDGTESEVTATLGEAALEDFFQMMPGHGGRGGRDGRGNGRGDGQGFGRGTLGVQLEETEQGVTVSEVVTGSVAEQIGIQAGDIIKSIAGTEVTSIDQVRSALRDAQETGEISLTLDRAGTTVELSFAVSDLSNLDLPEMPGFNFGRGGRMPFAGAFLGIETALLDETTAQEYGVTQTSGLYIVRVLQDSAAAEAGLQAQDIITAINGQAVTDTASLRTALSELSLGDAVTLDVLRGDETIQVEVTLEMMPGAGLRFPFPIVPDAPNQSDEQEDQKSA